MKIHICDICKKEKPMFFKCKIKRHSLSFEVCGDDVIPFDGPMWFKAEICEDCLKKITEEVRE